jgi:hypothetical protein
MPVVASDDAREPPRGDPARSVARLSTAGPPSIRLVRRASDHGVMWPAVSRRCRHTLPPELRWAVLLFTPKPLAVVCGREQAEAL